MTAGGPAPPLPTRPVWHYVAAFVAYVVLGVAFKSVFLNWIVGPLFPLVVLHLLPRLLRGLRPPTAGVGS